ncbi:hypothetical protein [Pantoea sp.]|uniref:hypothetical protein n=1 Tax=Pantoea sp. TaxID=69393 RepID=UPI0028AEF0FA|nr:hypothetical protein [Pantoea sp.]
MTRALLLAIGLSFAGTAIAGSINGSIGARLVIYSRCEISTTPRQSAPQIACGRQPQALPRVTESQLQGSVTQRQRLITVEW